MPNQVSPTDVSQLVPIWHRLLASMSQQFRPEVTSVIHDPITGRRVFLVPARAKRSAGAKSPVLTVKPVEACFFCNGATPSTIFAIGHDGSLIVPTETASFEAAEHLLLGRDPLEAKTYFDLSAALAEYNRADSRPAAVRVFANLTPAMVSPADHCLVVALADPQWHGLTWDRLPPLAVECFMRALQVLEDLARLQRLTPVMFINQGAAAGATVACPHAQAYLLATPPAVHHEIQQFRMQRGTCGVCEVLGENVILDNETMRLVAHPAPVMNCSLLAAPRRCTTPWLSQVPAADLAQVITTALTIWQHDTDDTDYNVLLRTGELVDHLHLEFIPRSGTQINTLAGFELSSGESIITFSPREVAMRLVS